MIVDPSTVSRRHAILILVFCLVAAISASLIFDWGILRLLSKILISPLKGL